jgi:excisionase family DNA binding protein
MIERHLHPTPDELQAQELFTLEEAADLLLLGLETVRHAVIIGELPAQVVGHDVVAIHREDMLTWFMATDHTSQPG